MTIFSKSGQIPVHQYCFVERSFLNPELVGVEKCVWFGLSSHPARMWGCHVLLESGAVYRSLPPHALTWSERLSSQWGPRDSQHWNCYGWQFSLIRYESLSGLRVVAKSGEAVRVGEYLFSAAPIGDTYSESPDQDKEFSFIRLDNGRLTIQPTDRVLFVDPSFTTAPPAWPSHLRRSTRVWSCES